MKVKIPLQGEINEELASELIKESAFVSEDIKNICVDLDERILSYHITKKETTDIFAIKDKMERFIKALTANYRSVPTKTLFERKRIDTRPFQTNVFDELVARGWVRQIGVGHVALSGPALKLFEMIDILAREKYNAAFSPEAMHFPAMVPGDILAKCGYFDSHPNNVSFISHLKNDFDIIETFRKKYGSGETMEGLAVSAIATPCNCLNPAACLPSYFTFQDCHLEKNKTISWMGRVFRYESTNVGGLERLWEYNVREIVFLGDTEFVTKRKTQAASIVADIFHELDLEYIIMTATDPFFATVASIRKFWQKSTEAKYEIKLTIAEDKNGEKQKIAAGSINDHNTLFGKRFNIKSVNGEFAASGCVGLGIERILLACFSQHGFEPKCWPEKIASAIF
jgi:seryl-tRNA synthetase